MKARFLASNGEDSNPCRKMKVEGFRESGGRVKRENFAGGDLAEGVNAPIGATGSGNGDRTVKDFEQCFFESELGGGIRILALPAEEIFSAVREKETVRNRLHGRVSGFRLGARDRRSSK